MCVYRQLKVRAIHCTALWLWNSYIWQQILFQWTSKISQCNPKMAITNPLWSTYSDSHDCSLVHYPIVYNYLQDYYDCLTLLDVCQQVLYVPSLVIPIPWFSRKWTLAKWHTVLCTVNTLLSAVFDMRCGLLVKCTKIGVAPPFLPLFTVCNRHLHTITLISKVRVNL